MEIVSRHTRNAFREYLVHWKLARIRDLFDAADVPLGNLAPDRRPSGERRGLVEEYYAGVDWSDHRDVKKVCTAFEYVLLQLSEPNGVLSEDGRERELRKLTNLLKRDGFDYVEGRIRHRANLDLSVIEAAATRVDRAVLREHLSRIERGINDDPEQAVGSAKELLETISKQILNHFGERDEEFDTIQQLVKAAMKSLNLSVEAIPDATKGASSLKQVLSGLNQIVGGVAELRNLYGTGHGRLRRAGLQPRHSRLVVGSVSALCTFLLETLDERCAKLSSAKPAPV